MYSSPDRLGQLARDHHHEMIAAARHERQARSERTPRTSRIPALTRRLATAFSRTAPAPTSEPV